MTDTGGIAAAVEDFRAARDSGDLWRRLHRHLDRFAVSGILYGMEGAPDPGRDALPLFNSIVPGWLDDKLGNDLFLCDEYVRAARTDTAPILWSDTTRIAAMPPEARRSLAIDVEYGITTGVTIPMRFAGGMGASSIGLHAAGLSWAEFDRIWAAQRAEMISIVNAFDAVLRRQHIGELFPLTESERDCLNWLSAGLKPKQIAGRLRLTNKQVEKRLASARGKLRAVTTPQAVATALVFGLIEP